MAKPVRASRSGAPSSRSAMAFRDYCIQTNAHALARYAALCQEAGIVPIVEPEVLMDADNTLEVCESVTSRTPEAVFAELDLQRVLQVGRESCRERVCQYG